MEMLLKKIYGSQLQSYSKIKVSLPMYLTEEKEFYEATIFDVKFIIVKNKSIERLNVVVLKKHIQKYYEHFNENIVLGFQTLASSQRRALVENNISYISENEQLFIPFLGSYFTKCQENQMSKPIDKFSPSTQLLALYMIYSEKSKRINKSEVAKRIGISAMSITRAVRDLAQIGVLQEEKVGNEVFIYCDMEKQDIYKEITPYLINPIQEIIYVSQIESEKELLLKAGEYSLSKRSMLGYPKYEEYALAKNSDFFERTETFNPDLDANVKLVRIQKWKYNPWVLGHDGMVDPISLICSFKNEEDERIQMSLDEVQGEIDKWQIMMN